MNLPDEVAAAVARRKRGRVRPARDAALESVRARLAQKARVLEARAQGGTAANRELPPAPVAPPVAVAPAVAALWAAALLVGAAAAPAARQQNLRAARAAAAQRRHVRAPQALVEASATPPRARKRPRLAPRAASEKSRARAAVAAARAEQLDLFCGERVLQRRACVGGGSQRHAWG